MTAIMRPPAPQADHGISLANPGNGAGGPSHFENVAPTLKGLLDRQKTSGNLPTGKTGVAGHLPHMPGNSPAALKSRSPNATRRAQSDGMFVGDPLAMMNAANNLHYSNPNVAPAFPPFFSPFYKGQPFLPAGSSVATDSPNLRLEKAFRKPLRQFNWEGKHPVLTRLGLSKVLRPFSTDKYFAKFFFGILDRIEGDSPKSTALDKKIDEVFANPAAFGIAEEAENSSATAKEVPRAAKAMKAAAR